MKQLSLFQRIIFVDWHGVASNDPFWTSILENTAHPLHTQLSTRLSEVFSRKKLVDDWMRGLITSGDLIAEMGISLDRRFGPDFLMRRMDSDCADMRVNTELLQVLKKLTPIVPIVVATDNVDCFVEVFEQALSRRRSSSLTQDRFELGDWASICDDIICSSVVGTLKAENPGGFFGPLLAEYNLGFRQALLIDDREDNCEAFRNSGGKAIRWKASADEISRLSTEIYQWLDWKQPIENAPQGMVKAQSRSAEGAGS